jgi:heme exporter protein C
MIAALYFALIYAPADALQGAYYRILYFHVPQGILSYVFVILLGFASLMYLIKGDMKWDRFGGCAAEVGLLVGSMSIISGMIWAKPAWGVYWAWDARLTLQLLLVLLLVAYRMLRAYLPNQEKRAALSCVFGLLAVIDIPFNYLSIVLWRTQHPQPVISPGGGGMDPDMNMALAVSIVAWTLIYVYLMMQRLQISKLEEEVGYLDHAVHSI